MIITKKSILFLLFNLRNLRTVKNSLRISCNQFSIIKIAKECCRIFFFLSWRVKFPFESPADIRDIRNARYSTEFSVVHDFTSMVEHICTRGSHSFLFSFFSFFFFLSFFFFFSKRHKCGQALVAAVS